MTVPDALSDDQLAAWRPFAAVLELLPPALNSALQRRTGLSLVGLSVLGHLQRQADGSSGVSDLAACTSSTLPRMSRLLARMEAEGLVTRGPCATDGRIVIATITERGRQAICDAQPHYDRIVHELLLDALSVEQVEQLRCIAAALADRLQPDAAAPVDRQRTLVPSGARTAPP